MTWYKLPRIDDEKLREQGHLPNTVTVDNPEKDHLLVQAPYPLDDRFRVSLAEVEAKLRKLGRKISRDMILEEFQIKTPPLRMRKVGVEYLRY